MNLAFCLFRYFPYGGQQRDFLRIAELCHRRGHAVHVFVMDLDGELPAEFTVTRVPARGASNHRRCLDFSRRVGRLLAESHFDAVVGFVKMPGLDVYYAADTCYREKVMTTRPLLYRLGSRYRTYEALERAVFTPAAHTQILLIAESEQKHFMRHYGTPPERFHLLPPGVDRNRAAPPNAAAIRTALRAELQLGNDDLLLLLVGSAFRTKGVDRAITALAALPLPLRDRVHLCVVGQDKAAPFQRLAQRLGVANQVRFLGGRADVPRFLLAADLLVHPAYLDNTGTVLVEALAAGLPVLASRVCGYARHVEMARGGLLIPSPFSQAAMNELLLSMLTSAERSEWSRNALAYAATADLYGLHEKAADLIESVARNHKR